ncbi:MAG: hypothetical protein OEV59_03170 [Deltaproteobacteria bacterium]|nr:hypothetical protein [Deltaproteobacteria bacterium]
MPTTAESSGKAKSSSGKSWLLEELQTKCIELDSITIGKGEEFFAKECAVSSFEHIGKVENDDYYVAFYCVIENTADEEDSCASADKYSVEKNYAIAVFKQKHDSKTAELVIKRLTTDYGEDEGGLPFESVKIITIPCGTTLQIISRYRKYYNMETFYIRNGKLDKKISFNGLWANSDKLIPAKERQYGWEATEPDLETMTITAMMAQKNDPPCCQSGPDYIFNLKCTGNRIFIDSLKKVDRSEER